jgi:hypothetical protein
MMTRNGITHGPLPDPNTSNISTALVRGGQTRASRTFQNLDRNAPVPLQCFCGFPKLMDAFQKLKVLEAVGAPHQPFRLG